MNFNSYTSLNIMAYHNKNNDFYLNKETEQPLLVNKEQPFSAINQHERLQENTYIFPHFRIPPDLDLCLLHQKATLFGFDSQQSRSTCPCCHQNVKTELTFSDATSRNIYKVNEPVGFYYTFIKCMLVALLLVILLPGIYSVIWVTQHCNSASHPQSCNFVFGMAFPKLSVFYSPIFILLSALNIVAIYIVIAFLFYWNVLIHEKISYSNLKASDHHSFISGFDSEYLSEGDLRSFLYNYQIEEVIFTYKIKQLMKLIEKKYQYQALKHKFSNDHSSAKVQSIASKLREIDNKLIPIKNLYELGRVAELRTDKIIIKFKSKQEKEDFQQQYSESFWETLKLMVSRKSKFVIKNVNLYVEYLGDPREIIWENLEIPTVKKYIYIFLNNVMMVVILGVSFVAVLKLTYSQQQYQDQSEAELSMAFSVIILVVNKILALYIDLSTSQEGRYNVTGEIMSKIIKKCIVYFFNVTLIPFSLLIIESYRQSQQDIIQNILTLFLVSNLIVPLATEFLQVSYFIKLFKRYRAKQAGKDCLYAQVKANRLFERNDFDLEDRYGLLCMRLTNCFFYAGIFPFGALITAMGLVLTFFTSKYILRKHSSLPKISFRLGILITRIAATFPIVYSLGLVLNLYTYNDQLPEDSLYTIVLLALSLPISLVFILKGHQLASKFIKPQKIQQSRINIISEVSYKDLNPCTFFFTQAQQQHEQQGLKSISTQLLANMMRFTAFREALNLWRLTRNQISSQIKQFEKESSALFR